MDETQAEILRLERLHQVGYQEGPPEGYHGPLCLCPAGHMCNPVDENPDNPDNVSHTTCDECGRGEDAGGRLQKAFNCGICDYDICIDCVERLNKVIMF